MVCGNGRVLKPERLAAAEPSAAEQNLRELARLNAWFGPHRILQRLLRHHTSPSERFTVLDVGAASGDMGLSLLRRFPNARVVSLDRSRLNLGDARPPRVEADAFHLPFAPASFDFVTTSLVLHHYPEAQVIDLLRTLRMVARRALIVLELERRLLAYYFLPATRWLFAWHDLTVHDGCASVEAGFRAAELAALARRAGARDAVVRRHRPWFRLSLVVPA